MRKTDVLVVGGSASGIVAATTAKAFHPGKSVLLVRREKQVLTPCGIPYIFATLRGIDQDLIPDRVLLNAGVDLLIDEVVAVDQEAKTCATAGGETIGFEKLVLALGSVPSVPKTFRGKERENLFLIPKDKEYLERMVRRLGECGSVIIVGGGFIGVEVADELTKSGKRVTLIEKLPHVLELAFDPELTIKAEEILKDRGVNVVAGVGVREVMGKGRVTGVRLESGEEIKSDAVILATGYIPATGLAEAAGIPLNRMGFVQVNEYMMTENRDVFAVGDCAEKKSFITRDSIPVMLASTACAEARIAAMNLYSLSAVKTFGGTIAIYSTAVGTTAFGVAGVKENLARERGFDIVTGSFQGADKHPGTMPGTQIQLVKLIASRESGVIIGGQVMGGDGTGELTNLIGIMIQNRMTVSSIMTAQIGTHPLLTAPPTAYPLTRAAMAITLSYRHG
ncbi:MAG TPA: FAD-dependent oxidoreductase [bacterium]|nr:FAD-dependent oxidoreductase [bacterium]HPJ71725.1 FAD-dependent oxidoreductase [bacterium]HPQ65113.1 FAD-dependent oxidoreductase [bacterium]